MKSVRDVPSGKRLNRFLAASCGGHLILATAIGVYLYVPREPTILPASIQMYMPDVDTDNPVAGKGKGNKDAEPNKKRDAEAGEGTESDSTPVNWGTAADPALDGGSRYAPQLLVNIGPEDYPPRARSANVNDVTVGVTVYLSGRTGRVRDFKIRGIRSAAGAHEPFTADFVEATRKILLTKTRMGQKAFEKDGVPRDFVWDTAVTFRLQ